MLHPQYFEHLGALFLLKDPSWFGPVLTEVWWQCKRQLSMQQKCGCCCGQGGAGTAGADALCWSLGIIPRKALTVPFSLQPGSHFHRRLGSGPGCAPGVADH